MNDIARDPWSDFRSLTAARIALGRAGGSLPTRELLDFGLAHARARDAVTMPLDVDGLLNELQTRGLQTMLLHTAARTRDEYLRRPDLGRRLSDESLRQLQSIPRGAPYDLCLIISDGLSARAVIHAIGLATALNSRLEPDGWRIAPVFVVPLARVALQDQIGEVVGTALSLILLGERPGLGSPDSLGAYFVHEPRVGKTDADRNCVSNIRPDGLPVDAAAATLTYLMNVARARRLSGVHLKDERLLTES